VTKQGEILNGAPLATYRTWVFQCASFKNLLVPLVAEPDGRISDTAHQPRWGYTTIAPGSRSAPGVIDSPNTPPTPERLNKGNDSSEVSAVMETADRRPLGIGSVVRPIPILRRCPMPGLRSAIGRITGCSTPPGLTGTFRNPTRGRFAPRATIVEPLRGWNGSRGMDPVEWIPPSWMDAPGHPSRSGAVSGYVPSHS